MRSRLKICSRIIDKKTRPLSMGILKPHPLITVRLEGVAYGTIDIREEDGQEMSIHFNLKPP